MKIGAVVFDLDHTLFDRYETLKLCAPELYSGFHEIISQKYDLNAFTNLLIEADKHCIHYGWSALFEYYVKHDLLKEGMSFPAENYLKALLNSYKHHAVKYSFTKDVLSFIKSHNLKTGLITNGAVSLQNAKLEILDIKNCFDEILISEQLGCEKPDTKLFFEMSKRLKLPPDKLIYVGDHPINDALASQKAGYTPVLVKSMGFFTMPVAKTFKYCIDDISYLPQLILKEFL